MDNKLVMNTSVNILVVANQYFLKIHQSIHIGIHNQIHNSIHNRIHQSIHKKIHKVFTKVFTEVFTEVFTKVFTKVFTEVFTDYLVLATVWDHQGSWTTYYLRLCGIIRSIYGPTTSHREACSAACSERAKEHVCLLGPPHNISQERSAECSGWLGL